MEGISFDVEDIVRSLREQEKSLDYEPGELEGLGERLATITRLKEKYGKTYGGIAEFEDWARKRLEELLHMKTDAEELESEKASSRPPSPRWRPPFGAEEERGAGDRRPREGRARVPFHEGRSIQGGDHG